METKDVFTKLASFEADDYKALPLALAGIALGVTTYYIKPAIEDVINALKPNVDESQQH